MGWMAMASHRETLGTRAGLVLQSQTLGTSSCFKWNMLTFGTDGHLMKHVLIMVVAIGKVIISAAAIWLIPTRKHNHNFAITATTETTLQSDADTIYIYIYILSVLPLVYKI